MPAWKATSVSGLLRRFSSVKPLKLAGKLRLVSWQRTVRHLRAPNAGLAADLLTAMTGVSGHTLAEERLPQLVQVVVQGQRAAADAGPETR